MAIATFIEKYQGTEYVHTHVYGSVWFVMLWMVMAVSAVAYILRRHVRSVPVLLLHFALLLILLGALLTHVTSWQGFVHLRQGLPTSICMEQHSDNLTSERNMPFFLRLDTFSIRYYSGTQAPSDYVSHFTVSDANGSIADSVSMNNIASVGSIRLYQSSYDEDMQGTTLSINCDPWGIPVSYAGYLLLFISQLLVLANPHGRFRRLLRSTASGGKVVAVLFGVCLFCAASPTRAAKTMSAAQADEFGRLNMLYGERICPVQTFAIDFTRKLYGKGHYKGYSAEQVLAGFLFFPDEWAREPIVRIKSAAVREHFHMPAYASLSQFFTAGHRYLLGPALHEYFAGNTDKLYQEVVKLDERIMLIMQLSRGSTMKLFPFQGVWYSPHDPLPASMEDGRRQYVFEALEVLGGYLKEGKQSQADEMLQKMQLYQRTYGASDIPSPTRLQAERIYNAFPFATILFMVCLTAGLLSLVPRRPMRLLCLTVLVVAFLSLTLCLALRWIVSGTIPMTNGYETMLLMAWIIMLASLLVYRRFSIILTFGLLLSGFLLLVSHLGQMDPQISNLMPVLASPLLSLHVSTIMMAYALLALTAASGAYGLWFRQSESEMHRLSLLLLYPALFMLTTGIFIGAIWANQSWGRYWGWDPKEVWALITMMVYAIPLHSASFTAFQRPRFYHAYMLLAFLSILMTFFGVNYFLGGMHSYAG